jgi:hypothetical protein
MTPSFDPVFSTAVRDALASTVRSTPRGSWLRRHLPLSIGALVALAFLGTAGTAVAGVWKLPGTQQIDPLGSVIHASGTGSTVVPLGHAPAGATNVEVRLTCLTADTFTFPGGTGVTCEAADLGSPLTVTEFHLTVTDNLTITTAHEARWIIRAQFTTETTTPLGVNAKKQTYGRDNAAHHPDLLAVVASNGKEGYAFQKDLAWAENGNHPAPTSPTQALQWQQANVGKVFPVPVYLSDGTTRIGTLLVGQP